MIEQQFIEYIVKQLVDNPDDVVAERVVDERGILLKLTVSPDDLGRVIGKHGATAQSLRSLLRALGTKNDSHYNLRIIDVDKEQADKFDSEKTGEFTTGNTEKVDTVEISDPENVENETALAKKTREELAELDDLDI